MDEYLRDAMRQRGWKVPRLAEECDVSLGLAAKWVSENPRYRVTPSPASCQKIATALHDDPDKLLALAGHRPQPDAAAADDPIERHIRQRTGDFREAVRGTPQSFWATIIDAVFDRAIDTARDMAHLVTIARTEDTTLGGSADTDSVQGDSEGNSRHQRPIKPREPAKFEFAQAV